MRHGAHARCRACLSPVSCRLGAARIDAPRSRPSFLFPPPSGPVSPTLGSLLGEYRLEAHLGRGGMGDVFRATHTRLGRTVALKVHRDGSTAARFLNEARIQAGLSHPHVATLYDHFEAGGHACIAMELVEGETLAERIERGGPLPFVAAVGLLRPIAEAVAYLHARGVIHRDLKAHNVKVTPGGHVKLLDFGIAKELGLPGLTSAGMVPGTPEYLAPEQVRGLAPDARSDVWALGVLLYEMVTGELPFQSSSAFELFERITRGVYDAPSTRVRSLPPAADALVARCLQADPRARFSDASALVAALPSAAPAALPPAPAAPLPLRRPAPSAASSLPLRAVALWAGAAVLLLALAVVGGRLLADRPSSEPDIAAALPEAAPVRPADAVPSRVIVSTVGPAADVYRNGVRIGRTPYSLDSYDGEQVELELRRNGAARPVEFETRTNQRAYSFQTP